MTPESAYGRPHRRPLRSIPTPTPSRPTLNPYPGDSPMVNSRLYAICRDTKAHLHPAIVRLLAAEWRDPFEFQPSTAGSPPTFLPLPAWSTRIIQELVFASSPIGPDPLRSWIAGVNTGSPHYPGPNHVSSRLPARMWPRGSSPLHIIVPRGEGRCEFGIKMGLVRHTTGSLGDCSVLVRVVEAEWHL